MFYTLKQEEYKKAMLEIGLTVMELANKATVSTTSINKLVKGRPCRAKTANKIAKALNVPVTDLFE